MEDPRCVSRPARSALISAVLALSRRSRLSHLGQFRHNVVVRPWNSCRSLNHFGVRDLLAFFDAG